MPAINPQQLVVFTLGGEQYALPIKQVQEIIRYTKPRSVAASESWVRGVLSLRGRLVPVYDIAARLGVIFEPGEQSKIVIVETETGIVGVIVDGVDEVRGVEDEQIDQAPGADPAVIDSIVKIGEHLVVLINPRTIFASLASA